MLDSDNNKYSIYVTLVNIGYSSMYLNDITIFQDIMHPLVLGYIDDKKSLDEKVLLPNVPVTFTIPLVNYDENIYDHKNNVIKLRVNVSGKMFKKEIDWTCG